MVTKAALCKSYHLNLTSFSRYNLNVTIQLCHQCFLATVVERYVIMTSKTHEELIQLWGDEQSMNMDQLLEWALQA